MRTGGGTAGCPGCRRVLPANASTTTRTAAPASARRRSSKASGMSPIVTTKPSHVCDGYVPKRELADDQVDELARHDDRLPDLAAVEVSLHLRRLLRTRDQLLFRQVGRHLEPVAHLSV